jgi:hypothetical protein
MANALVGRGATGSVLRSALVLVESRVDSRVVGDSETTGTQEALPGRRRNSIFPESGRVAGDPKFTKKIYAKNTQNNRRELFYMWPQLFEARGLSPYPLPAKARWSEHLQQATMGGSTTRSLFETGCKHVLNSLSLPPLPTEKPLK